MSCDKCASCIYPCNNIYPLRGLAMAEGWVSCGKCASCIYPCQQHISLARPCYSRRVDVVWKGRFAPLPHDTHPPASAAGASIGGYQESDLHREAYTMVEQPCKAGLREG